MTGYMECNNPIAFAAMAKRSDPDSPRYHEAMASIDSESFKEAMVVEINALMAKDTWTASFHYTTSIHSEQKCPTGNMGVQEEEIS